ncbi:hypothetical protein APHAL10511_003315 [Amanita phalloides]|nr:hypothetical protein APHAL10511_003315 [Amanita phalloides]
MMTQFGWSDTLYALSSCLACTTVSSSTDSLHNYVQHAHGARRSSTFSGNGEGRDRNRERTSRLQSNAQPLSDALRPLLLEESTDDEYTDTLSLHSNVGRRDGRSRYSHAGSVVSSDADGNTSAPAGAKLPKSKSKGKGKKRRQDDGLFTVLGYDLFGTRKPAIQLPLTDDEEEYIGRNNGSMRRTQSGGTLDSDAYPLDDEAIAALSRAHIAGQRQHDAQIKQDEEEELSETHNNVKRVEKEERRRGRREQKEKEPLAGALMTGMSNSHGEFEGFQGSGDGVLFEGFKSPSASASSMGTGTSVALEAGDVDEETLVDLDGSLYARTVSGVPRTNAIVSESQTTLSTTTGGNSNFGPHRRSRSDQFHDDMFRPAFQHPNELQKKKPKSNRKKPTLSSSSISASTSTGTRSPSLPSPTGSTSLGTGLSHSISLAQSGSQAHHQPFPHPSSMTKNMAIAEQLYFDNVPSANSRGFPSVGFGAAGRRRGDSQSNGVFLARRGDE